MNTNIYNHNGELIDHLSISNERFLILICPDSGKFKINSNGKFINDNNDIVDEFEGKIVTIWLAEDDNTHITEFTVDGEIYRIKYVDTNIIPEHYNTLITNKHLPDNPTILNCVVDKERYMILGKLLLEFKNIMRYKGTITTVQKFLNFIGFKHITLYDEFRNKDGSLTLTKNLDSIKTGYYHVIYEHDYSSPDNGFDRKNFPITLRDDNVVDFIDILWDAIKVAKKHFMIPEQDISFFGINFTTNVGRFLSIAQNTYAHHYTDSSYYIYDKETFNIDVFIKNKFDVSYVIKDCMNVDNMRIIDNQEVKLIPVDITTVNQDVFYVQHEINDENLDEIDTNGELLVFNAKYGTILNLDFLVPGKYMNYELINTDNPLVIIKKDDKQFINERYQNRIFISRPGKYKLTIDFYNEHNNRERFFYFFTVNKESHKLDYEEFSSGKLEKLTSKTIIKTEELRANVVIEFATVNAPITREAFVDRFSFIDEDVKLFQVINGNKIYAVVESINWFAKPSVLFDSIGKIKSFVDTSTGFDGNLAGLFNESNIGSLQKLMLTSHHPVLDLKGAVSLSSRNIKLNNVLSLEVKNVTDLIDGNFGIELVAALGTTSLMAKVDLVMRVGQLVFLDCVTSFHPDSKVVCINKRPGSVPMSLNVKGLLNPETYTWLFTYPNIGSLSIYYSTLRSQTTSFRQLAAYYNNAAGTRYFVSGGGYSPVEYTSFVTNMNSWRSVDYNLRRLGINPFVEFNTEEIQKISFNPDINLDVESTMLHDLGLDGKGEPIHRLSDFNNLTEYFVQRLSSIDKYLNLTLTEYRRYFEEPYNDKYKMGESTRIPMRYINNWIHVSAFKVIDNTFTLSEIEEHKEKHKLIIVDVYENHDGTVLSKYLMVIHRRNGNDNEKITNPKLEFFSSARLPLNFDFDIVTTDSTTNALIEKIDYQSLYPRLTYNTIVLKLNDIIYCRPNIDQAINFRDVKWRILDHISKKLIFESVQYSLKYRIKEKMIYDIEMLLEINGTINRVYKEKVFSSFDVKLP